MQTGERLDKSSILYKENEKWVNKLKSEGYEIQDIGNPNKVIESSIFYDMEKGQIFK